LARDGKVFFTIVADQQSCWRQVVHDCRRGAVQFVEQSRLAAVCASGHADARLDCADLGVAGQSAARSEVVDESGQVTADLLYPWLTEAMKYLVQRLTQTVVRFCFYDRFLDSAPLYSGRLNWSPLNTIDGLEFRRVVGLPRQVT
jgi:hypothetical protein